MLKINVILIFFMFSITVSLCQDGLWKRIDSVGYNYYKIISCNDNEFFGYYVNSGLKYSSDNGSTLNWFRPNVPFSLQNMIVTNYYIFMTGTDQNIYYSRKVGSTWNAWQEITLSGGILTNKIITSLSIASWGGNLYAGTSNDGVFTWDGSNWHKSNTGLEGKYITCLLRSESNTNVFSGTSNGLYKSTDRGINWDTCGFSNQFIQAINMDSNENLIVSSHTKVNPVYKLFFSKNEGNIWEDITFNLPNSSSNWINCDVQNTIYVGIPKYGIYKLKSDSVSWEKINDGLLDTNVHSMGYSPKGFLYTSVDSGLYRLSLNNFTDVFTKRNNIFKDAYLEQNYPNPFNPTTTIDFSITNASYIKLEIFNLIGQKIADLINEEKQAGKYSIKWNAENFASGIYIYKLSTGYNVFTQKMILIK